jgi:hypothetical protein
MTGTSTVRNEANKVTNQLKGYLTDRDPTDGCGCTVSPQPQVSIGTRRAERSAARSLLESDRITEEGRIAMSAAADGDIHSPQWRDDNVSCTSTHAPTPDMRAPDTSGRGMGTGDVLVK